MRGFLALTLIMPLAACAGAEATRTSANTMIIDASAAPACGGRGAARVAAKSAAVETLRAGYERYMIVGASAQNNVTVTQMPGTVQTSGTATYGGGIGTFNSRSTYMPGPTITAGSHDRALAVVMFRRGDPGFENAIDAREALGPEWQKLVQTGIRTCG